jgi:hypothetical protein
VVVVAAVACSIPQHLSLPEPLTQLLLALVVHLRVRGRLAPMAAVHHSLVLRQQAGVAAVIFPLAATAVLVVAAAVGVIAQAARAFPVRVMLVLPALIAAVAHVARAAVEQEVLALQTI